MKEEIFSKFKDYNRKLEKILEKKDFSKDTKNLLLSMFYKIETSYNDYFIVKRRCKTKQEYLENILNNVKQCNSIELVKPSDEDFETFKEKLYKTDIKLKKIKVIANELCLLSAIMELNDFQIYLPEEYNLIRNSMPYLLNTAYEMENIEVLRDFNAWSWNTLINEIKDKNINLIYQNLRIALTNDIFETIQKKEGYIDVLQIIKEDLMKIYDEKLVDTFMTLIFKISIIIYINKSQNESKRLLEEREILETELDEIKNKKLYIENITSEKKKLTNNLKQIDLIMNSKELLLKEYQKRNGKLPEYNKIFSVSHLVEKMQRERTKILEKIDLCNKKIEPTTYLANKSNLQKNYNLLKDIKFDENNNIYKYIDKLQKVFMQEIFLNKIENANTQAQIIDCMYELRYYNFIPYNDETTINKVNKFKNDIEGLEEKLIEKLYSNKLINTISTNKDNDIKILKNIFDLKIINMEYIYIEIKKKEKNYVINMYDEKETLEKSFEMNLEFNKKDKIKLNKKIKLFI